MTLPTNFSESEFLQDGIKRIWNKKVLHYFQDVSNDDDLSSNRAQLKRLCLHRENDSVAETQMRITVFQDIKMDNFMSWISHGLDEENQQEPRPVQFLTADNHPLIVLFFSGDLSSSTSKNPVRGRLSFRLQNYVNFEEEPGDDVITEIKLKQIATKIKEEFATPIFSYAKGKERYSYFYPKQGYWDTANCFLNLPTAESVFRKLVSIQGHTYIPERINFNEKPHKNSISNNTRKVKGYNNKLVNEKNYRRVGRVYFRYAYADIGTGKNIRLVDTVGLDRTAFISI